MAIPSDSTSKTSNMLTLTLCLNICLFVEQRTSSFLCRRGQCPNAYASRPLTKLCNTIDFMFKHFHKLSKHQYFELHLLEYDKLSFASIKDFQSYQVFLVTKIQNVSVRSNSPLKIDSCRHPLLRVTMHSCT